MSALDRLPPLVTTGVGSLPFDDPVAAVRHAGRAYGLPFCPQLPRHDGDMVHEWLGRDWSATPCGWTTERDRERPAAWDAFVTAMAAEPPEHRLVKLQVTGPVTLAVALERAAGRPGVGRDVSVLAREVGGWLATNAAAQVARLSAIGLDALVVVDEPGLAAAVGGDEAAVSVAASALDVRVWDPLRSVGAAWGLHVCSHVPWALVRRAEPDVVSFDVTRYAVGGAGASALAGLIAGGGRIAWGALNPVQPDDPADVAARVGAGVGAITATGTAVDAVFAASLVTPACGTGRLSPERERLVASVVEVGAEVAAATWRSWPGVNVQG